MRQSFGYLGSRRKGSEQAFRLFEVVTKRLLNQAKAVHTCGVSANDDALLRADS